MLAVGRDLDGRISSINTAIGGTGIQNLSYGYDLASNITSITDGLSSGRSQTFTYDNLNRLASGTGYYGALSYSYDGVGNRLTTVNGTTTDTYVYSPTANRISTISRGSNVRTLSYLASGQTSEDVKNPLTDVVYGYDSSGRLASTSINGSTVGSYTHNALGQRVSKTAGAATTVFLYDPAGHLIEEANSSGAVLRDFLWLDGLPIGQVDDTGSSPAIYFVHADQLNRPQKLTDGSGAIAWDGIFDPFGIASSATGPATNLLMFPGQYADSESGLSQNWMRDYDPTIGRYIESDPIGLLGGINLYAYVSGNPINEWDPFGLCDQPTNPCYKPGDKFPTEQQAAGAAIRTYDAQSIAQDREYAGRIYEKYFSNTYSFTSPNIGTVDQSDPGICIFLNCGATYHTHGALTPGYLPEQYSDADFNAADQMGQNSYLGTPSGDIREYTPGSDTRASNGRLIGTGADKPCIPTS